MAIQSVSTGANLIQRAADVARNASSPIRVMVDSGSGLSPKMQAFSATARDMLPITGLALSTFSLAGMGAMAFIYARKMFFSKPEYPKPNKDTVGKVKNAHKKIQENLKTLKDNYTVPGRPVATSRVKEFFDSAYNAANTGSLPQKGLMFYGSTGTGKTHTVNDMLNKAGFKTVKMPSVQEMFGGFCFRSKGEILRDFLKDVIAQRDKGEPVALFIDEMDQYFSKDLEEDMKQFLDAAKDHQIPVIGTTNHPNDINERSQRRFLTMDPIELNSINDKDDATVAIQSVMKAKGIECEFAEEALSEIYEICTDTKSSYVQYHNQGVRRKQSEYNIEMQEWNIYQEFLERAEVKTDKGVDDYLKDNITYSADDITNLKRIVRKYQSQELTELQKLQELYVKMGGKVKETSEGEAQKPEQAQDTFKLSNKPEEPEGKIWKPFGFDAAGTVADYLNAEISPEKLKEGQTLTMEDLKDVLKKAKDNIKVTTSAPVKYYKQED